MPNPIRTVALVSTVLALAGCAAGQPAGSYAEELTDRITTDAIIGHLEQFQQIADDHGGNRQTGTPGYQASVDYVSRLLTEKGFDVYIDEFEAGVFDVQTESLRVDDTGFPVRAVEHSAVSPDGGVTGPLLVAPDEQAQGCTAADYGTAAVDGAVAVAWRGGCSLADKAAAATERGAVGLVIVNNVDEAVFGGRLLEEDEVALPVLSVSRIEGMDLVRRRGTATAEVQARVEQRPVRSVIAQTTTGSAVDVVMVGAHLDSTPLGPGIDDNASGVAAVLETALQMGPKPPIENGVRFAFWAGGKEWMLGSQHYVGSLDDTALSRIALYLDADMIASPDPQYLVLDSDGTLPPHPQTDVRAPEGSVAIEHAFTDYLAGRGVTPDALLFDGRGDWNPFARTGIPIGALSTGRSSDDGDDAADDTIARVSRDALDITAPAIAHLVGLYAQDQTGPHGVPSYDDRTRRLLEP